MKLLRASTTVFYAALIGAAFSTSVKADDWNNKTTVTFSGPVEIPGVHLQGYGTLPAGTYVFKLLDSKSDRHIVQIFSQDEKTVYATILAIPNFRLQATDKTVITFSERPAGEPEALRAWFYPGKQWGDEFVYPKSRAMEIAKTNNTPVLYTEAEIPPNTPSAPVAELKQAPVMAVQPTGETVELAAVVTPPPPAEVATAQAPVADTLPATGSSMPLIGLIGLLALCPVWFLRSAEKRAQ
jgi:hypothetical protein